jgi:hypothetical protein
MLALAVSAGSPAATEPDWAPSGCSSKSRLPLREVRLAEEDARQGNISASVSLECHFLAVGDQAAAIRWLRQSALREPLTGRRYVRYLLSVGGKAHCFEAHTLAVRYLALEWLPVDVREEVTSQRDAALRCRQNSTR